MRFDMQHVEIGPKMAEIAKIMWDYVKIVWNCMKECIRVRESITIKFLSSSTCILIPNMLLLTKKLAEIAKIAWNCGKIAWYCVRECMKVSPLNFSARVHAFWYPTCWNWPKNGWNSQNCVKIAWNCVKLREHAREIFCKYYQWISQLKYMHFDTQHGWDSQNCMKLCENWIEVCKGMCESGWKYYHWIS